VEKVGGAKGGIGKLTIYILKVGRKVGGKYKLIYT
jgi:hypothetical protein